ncbi:MAG: HNH endonuclease, partial [Parvularculaceae bacterium]
LKGGAQTRHGQSRKSVSNQTAAPTRAQVSYAHVSQYLDFDRPAPFRLDDQLFEGNLVSDGKTGLSGDFRNAVRLISDLEFESIVTHGFSSVVGLGQAHFETPTIAPGFAEDAERFEYHRPWVERLVSKPFRDEAFARHVKLAYNATCALTGLSMRNGGGRTEVDAAHIKPVGEGHAGPDSVRNGLALSKTVHWMFDRGLLSVDSDFRILTAKRLVPEPIQRLLFPSGYIQLPEDKRLHPHQSYLAYHREKIFKDSRE